MRSRYRVRLGDVHLDTLDKNLMILDVSHSPMQPRIQQTNTADLNGFEPSDAAYIEKNTVTVTFELHIYDIAKRNEACQKVNAWAQAGGSLRVNERSGQYLRWVRCARYANIASARNWTDPLTLVFETTYVPYWTSTTDSTLTLTGKAPKGNLSVDGNTGNALVMATITAQANVTSIQITAGSTTLKLTGLSMKNKDVMEIDYVHSRYLRIRVNGKSVMGNLNASSSDLLTVPCGAKTAIAISASGKVKAAIRARGYWL